MKITKFLFPYIVGLFFGYLLSAVTKGDNAGIALSISDIFPSLKFISIVAGFLFALAIITDFFVWVIKKAKTAIVEKFLKIKHLIQKERAVNFSPVVYWDEKKGFVFAEIHSPKNMIFYSKTNVSIKYNKPKMIVQEKNHKHKYDYLMNTLHSQMKNPSIKEAAIWTNNLFSTKIWIGSSKTLNIFTIDKDDNIFYLSRKGKKPKRFWNEETLPEFYDISWKFGNYDFDLNIIGVDFLGRKLIQMFSFSISYDEKGLMIRNL